MHGSGKAASKIDYLIELLTERLVKEFEPEKKS